MKIKDILKELRKNYSDVNLITEIESFIVLNYSEVRDYGKNPKYGKTIGLIGFEILYEDKGETLEVLTKNNYSLVKKEILKDSRVVAPKEEEILKAWNISLSETMHKITQESNVRYIIDIREAKEEKTFFLLEKVFWDIQFVEHTHSKNIEDIYECLKEIKRKEECLESYHN